MHLFIINQFFTFLLFFQTYLNRLILQDTNAQIDKVKNNDKLTDEEQQQKIAEIERQCVSAYSKKIIC